MLIAFNKPYGALSQFTAETPGQHTLAEFGLPKDVYPIGRLDADSEGLLLLSDEPGLNEQLLHPGHAHAREYWAQVERIPAPEALLRLSHGVVIQGRKTRPCRAWILDPQPGESEPHSGARKRASQTSPNTVRVLTNGATIVVPHREPPIRFRKTVPACWIGLELMEGRNRQVRRMTAAIGHPTLRLIRVRIGGLRLEHIPAGNWKSLSPAERRLVLS